MIAPDLVSLACPLDRLEPLPGNPRRGDVEAVARSYERFGQRKPIVARRTGTNSDGDPCGVVIAGNHQWEAAQRLGWDSIAVVWTDDDDLTAHAFALADNRTGEIGSYDDEALAAMLSEVAVDEDLLAATAFSADDVSELLDSLRPELVEDEVGAVPAEPVSRPGDLWLLGDHRVLCGDSSERSSYSVLLGDAQVDCVWTDPPYGVDYAGKTADALTIQNDGVEGLSRLLADVFGTITEVGKEGAAVYVAHPSGRNALVFTSAFIAAGWRLHQGLVWDKQTIALGHSDYHFAHEPILFGYLPGGGRRGRGGSGWDGDNAQRSIISVPKPSASREHPTMKPVELVAQCVRNSAPRMGLVLDPFGGSGSTVLACEGMGRQARLIEIDPAYVDVVCGRWQRMTGGKPVLEETGEPYDFVGVDG